MTVVDDIKARLDILDVVSERVPLQRSGRSYKANCPFHQERTPSFHVFPDRQSWRCFGACATGGDAFSFVMRADNLEFGEALRQLAQQTGVTLPERGTSRPRQDTAYEINERAKSFFQRQLASAQGTEAREYLDRRRLDRQAIEKFEIGLSPADGESLRNHLTREGYSAEQLAGAGVVRTGDDGFHHDLFRGRLMFPIRDAAGQLVGFGGRSLDGSEPKYLNSPQGDVFDKSRLLYGLDRAKEEIRKDGAVIVEGYMDVIAAHQAGFNNVVASMGTALTEHQVGTLRRLTGQVLMALDQDSAGQQATLRSLESSWRIYQNRVAGRSQGITLLQRQELPELKILALPEGQDPDDVIHRSPAEWSRLLENAQPLVEYMIAAAASHLDASTPQGKAQIVDAVFPLIAAATAGTQQDHYFQMLADRLNVSLETLRASVGRPTAARRARMQQPRAADAATSPFAKLNHDPLEEYCLALLMKHPDLKDSAEHLKLEFFRCHENREIFSQWRESEPVDIGVDLEPEILRQLETVRAKALPPLDPSKRQEALADVISRLEERDLRSLKAEEEIRFAESPPDLDDAEHQDILSLNQRIKKNEDLRRGLYQEISP
jgi:DNA primase